MVVNLLSDMDSNCWWRILVANNVLNLNGNTAAGAHVSIKKSHEPKNFASTTARSLTGVVNSASKVPVDFSCAKVRMVITGAINRRMSQKKPLLGIFSVSGISKGLSLSASSTINKLAPSKNCTPAMIT